MYDSSCEEGPEVVRIGGDRRRPGKGKGGACAVMRSRLDLQEKSSRDLLHNTDAVNTAELYFRALG